MQMKPVMVTDIAEFLRFSEVTVYRLIERCLISAYMAGDRGQLRIKETCSTSSRKAFRSRTRKVRLMGRGPVSAGRVSQVISGHAACATVPRSHVRWLGEPPPRRSDRVSPGGESGPPGAPGPSAASPDRCPTPSTRRARPALGRRVVMQVAGIVTPDTILRWYRRVIAQTDDGSARRGRGVLPPSTVATPPLSRSNQTA